MEKEYKSFKKFNCFYKPTDQILLLAHNLNKFFAKEISAREFLISPSLGSHMNCLNITFQILFYCIVQIINRIIFPNSNIIHFIFCLIIFLKAFPLIFTCTAFSTKVKSLVWLPSPFIYAGVIVHNCFYKKWNHCGIRPVRILAWAKNIKIPETHNGYIINSCKYIWHIIHPLFCLPHKAISNCPFCLLFLVK